MRSGKKKKIKQNMIAPTKRKKQSAMTSAPLNMKDVYYPIDKTKFYCSPNGHLISDLAEINLHRYIWIKTDIGVILYLKPKVEIQNEHYLIKGFRLSWEMQIKI